MQTIHYMSKTYAPTLKEVPSEAEIASHRLLLRAGMIRKVASGIYSYLPLAMRSIAKIEDIVRQEMARIDCQELQMPIVQPAELWKESGRWDLYGPELARLTDRHGRDFCLGPTHEEVITTLVRNEVRSYRELPLSLYQIHTKFRDEIRPRFGLLRGREFIMKDAYSFHATEDSLREHYDQQADAYHRICQRIGLDYRPVEADSGQIGGKVTTEFMALADAGEAEIVHCACGYAANTEVAESRFVRGVVSAEPVAVSRVHTPGAATIESLADQLGVDRSATVKNMAGMTDSGQLVLFFIPGDRELNLLKAEKALGPVRLLEDDDFKPAGLTKGFIGPVGSPQNSLIVADESLAAEMAWTVGANEADYHLVGACPGRDFTVDSFVDLTVVAQGDLCPQCGAPLGVARGIEVSQVFQLGTKYSEAFGAKFLDENGKEQPFFMGCYGVGVSRSLAAAIEQHHDDAGIAWPISIAPYHVGLIVLDVEGEVYDTALGIASGLASAGAEVIVDDRDARPGVKFNEADLLGWPVQVVIGGRGLAKGIVEVKVRSTGARSEVPVAEAEAFVHRVLSEMWASVQPAHK